MIREATESREALERVAEEQAALRRVATLVAREAPQPEVFGAIAEEVGRLVGCEEIRMLRFESDRSAVVVGLSGRSSAFPIGSRQLLEGDSAASRVLHTGRTTRIDDYDDVATGPMAETARSIGIRAVVGAPIRVAGRLWGVVTTGSTGDTPLPPDTESRLGKFTELMATAIANAEARAQVQRLAEEQAALLRLATLVADGVPPREIFSAVSDEVAQLFAANGLVLRFEEDGLGIVSVGVSAGNDIPAGTRWEFEEGMASLEVYRTGSSARVDAFDWSAGGGPAAETAERVGIVSSVSNPILVQNRLWGAITVFSTSERLPDETEDRLERFAQLVATAIANAESRDAVSRTRQALELVAAEQAALRRVATLVAQDAAPAEVFEAVSVEVDRLFRLDADTSDVAGVVRFDSGPALLVVGVSRTLPAVPLGSRWEPIDLFAPTRVLRTGRSARVDEDDPATVGGPVADFLRSEGYLSQVASPIVVGGRLWGAISVNSAETLPPDAEDRLEKFTELVAAAIANAESHQALASLAEEQAALRRVATLVALDAPSAEVFAAVAAEVGNLFHTEITIVGRYDGDGAATAIGNWSASGRGVPVGTRSAIGGRNVLTMVAETGKPARVDGYDDASGEAADIARLHGWHSSIAAPIVVEGRLWGVMLVATERPEPFPAAAEERLAAFTELVATAVANAEAHDELRRFGDEQAALSRVATLVADGGWPEQVFEAVVHEVSNLLGLERIELVRYDGAATGTVVAASGDHPFPAGTTWSLDDPSVMATVARTGRAARLDDYDSLTGAIAGAARDAGFRSAIGEPITVEGRLWGVIIAISTDPEPIPEGSQARLAQFTGLIATAIANAESRAEVEQLANEQAALRRVATLVAAGAMPADVFGAAAEEAQRILELPLVVMSRYEADGTATVVVATGEHAFQPGTSWPLDGPAVSALVRATGRPASVDYADLPGAIGQAARAGGLSSGLGVPIVVNGSVWGVMVTASSDRHPLPPDTEARLADFTDLVATAISNAASRVAVARLADEQAALRRVATLVARGAPPEEIFAAAVSEVGGLLGVASATMNRYEPDDTVVTVASFSTSEPVFPVGRRWPAEGRNVAWRVLQSHRSARVDSYAGATDPIAVAAQAAGYTSAVGSPIVVEGELWGVITTYSSEGPMPPGTEERLGSFTELVATAIANAESRSALNASRRRIVAASDETRRRIERDLHDGTQQRLVSLGLALRAAEANLPPERDDLRVQLSGVATGLVAAVEDLQEISRGIHPAILSKGGLAPALQTLAHRSAIPVDLDITTEVRLAEQIEVAAYFVASEALANAAKHSQASRIDVSLEQRDGSLALSVRDDGVGGADAARGSGLVGLTDRVEALGGSIRVSSRPGEGTQIAAELPLELGLPQPAGSQAAMPKDSS